MDVGLEDDLPEYTVLLARSPGEPTVVDAVAGSGPVAVEPAAMGFIYLDVGGWYGNPGSNNYRRDFAVVHGNWVALCSFVESGGNFAASSSVTDFEAAPAGRSPSVAIPVELQPIDALLHTLAGDERRVSVVRSMRYAGTYERFPTECTLVLGDWHMPLVSEMPPVLSEGEEGTVYAPDGPVAGRLNYYRRDAGDELGGEVDPADGSIGSPPALYHWGRTWFEQYMRQDIHQDAAVDTLEILERFEDFQQNTAPQIDVHAHVLQIGDLLDFWIGFDCFWEPSTTHDIVLSGPSAEDLSGGEFVKYWCDRVSDEDAQRSSRGKLNARALRALSELDGTVLIQGNHDNYLRLPHPLNIGPQRVVRHIAEGFWAEHGHDTDHWNWDGSTSGWNNAQKMMTMPGMRWVGELEDLREPYLKYSAQKWLDLGEDRFAIFAMGHTHAPALAWVNIKTEPPRPPLRPPPR